MFIDLHIFDWRGGQPTTDVVVVGKDAVRNGFIVEVATKHYDTGEEVFYTQVYTAGTHLSVAEAADDIKAMVEAP